MDFLTDPDFWLRWLKVVGIDLLLAGDNALVIALAVRTLSPRNQLLGRIWGTAGAVGLRLIFIGFISMLLEISFLYFVGGAVLVWIAFKLILQGGGEHDAGKEGSSLWEAIWIIIVADVSMSIDNVLAISGAAGGDMKLVIFGIGLSIPLVVWGSGLLSSLMNRFPWIIWLAAACWARSRAHDAARPGDPRLHRRRPGASTRDSVAPGSVRAGRGARLVARAHGAHRARGHVSSAWLKLRRRARLPRTAARSRDGSSELRGARSCWSWAARWSRSASR
jgi:YjbE family integral membrane protein